MVQQLLSEFASFASSKKDACLHPYLTKEELGLLVNPSVTELNCLLFNSISKGPIFSNFLLDHALENCPKITKIELLNRWRRCDRKTIDTLPVQLFKYRWNNLKSLKCYNDFIVYDNTLRFIQENFPNIESVLLFKKKMYLLIF